MPSYSVHRSHAKKKRSDPTHREVMEKRHAKRRKNEKKNLKAKKISALKEYQRLSKVEFVSKKTTAMNIMEIIEEVKEKLTDGSYLQIMDQLMALNRETESHQPQTPHHIHGDTSFQDDSDDDYIINYFRDYYFDRAGNRDNINREDNIIREDTNIEAIRNTTNRFINNITDSYQRAYPENDNWYRTADGTWREINHRDRRWEIQRDVTHT